MPRLEEQAFGELGPDERVSEPRTRSGTGGGSGRGPSGPGGTQHGGPRQGSPIRKPTLIVGALAAVLVLAIGAVAFAAKGSSQGSAQAATAAKASVGISTSPSASAKKSTAKASAKSTTKASAKASATKSRPTATRPSAPSATAPLSVPAGWTQTLDAGFSGSSLNTSLWSTCYYWAASAGCTNNPSTEKEWYLPSQVQVSNGALNLVAQQETTEGVNTSTNASEEYSCRSGMVTSAPGFNFTYGLITITAKVPFGTGLWPALWLAASNHDWPPELDIMEHWDSESQVKVYDHTVGSKYIGGVVPTPGGVSDGFHTYSLMWTKSRVTWYIDGSAVYSTTSYVPQQAMYFIANVADDSTASGACDGTMEIQSVKVWQP
jgi:beta-glucanase (GH16 family)